MADAMLPVLARRAEIEAALRRSRVLILTGETGSGKTTQLPQIVWGMGGGGGGERGIAVTQPRRLAARAVASRLAEEMRVPLGGLVGSKVRFEDRTGRDTRITVLTDGMLLAELAGDRDLAEYSTIIIDEAHERSLNIDVLLGYLKGLVQRRKDLKVVVTSATIEPRRFSDFFGGPDVAPVIEVSGRTFPVDVRYRASRIHQEDADVDVKAVVDAVEELQQGDVEEGDVLCFLPGEREIRDCANALARTRMQVEVLPLYSRLSNAEQDRIFHPAKGGKPRVILATNVAETSLTVPGIRHVIDTGLERRSFYDALRKVQTLPVVPVSRASADQRKGRCGRVAAGVCIRLYSSQDYQGRPVFTEPEIRRTSLASVILQAASLGLPSLDKFPLIDPPDPHAIREGYETLVELGAVRLRSGERSHQDLGPPGYAITEIGRKMSRIPTDPRIARMMVAAEAEDCVREVVELAAVLSIRDPRDRPHDRQRAADDAHAVFKDADSDFITLLNIFEGFRHASEEGGTSAWCGANFINSARMREWADTARQLAEIARELGMRMGEFRLNEPGHRDRIHRALLTGLISNMGCRDGEAGSFDYKGVKGNVVSLFPGSVLFKKGPKWIMAAEIVQTTKLYARTVAKVEPEWIEELAGHVLERQLTDPHLDADTGEPSAWERATMNGIVVIPRRRVAIASVDPAKARTLFIRDAMVLGKWKGAGGYIGRVRAVMDSARSMEAKLRRKGVLRPESELVAWFERTLPAGVVDPSTLAEWRSGDSCVANPLVGVPKLADVLAGDAKVDAAAYPDWMELAGAEGKVTLTYAMASGADEDGMTATIEVADLPAIKAERAAWLVPGMLADLVTALLKTLPKAQRAAVEAHGDLDAVGRACAEVMAFGEGSLAAAVSETIEVLYGVTIEPSVWSFKALSKHLVLRVSVVDAEGEELAADRDLAKLQERFAVKSAKARAARARARFERDGITAWDFGVLPEVVEVGQVGGADDERPAAVAYPAVIDRGDSCGLTLMESKEQAAAQTVRGIRRLFSIVCGEQVAHELATLGNWAELVRWYGAFGTEARLRDDMTLLIVERAFLAGQPAPRSAREFEERQQAGWGKLSMAVREVAEMLAKMLEPRAKVAQRLASGTNRNWAASMADLREQAAYLMPVGFLAIVPWERLRDYPRYAEGMRARLMSLREDGSGAEKVLLEQFGVHWKKFTAWVAQAMAKDNEPAPAPPPPAGTKSKAPLPQAKRAAPTVNLDAGAWAMQPGRLPAAVEQYRWALEELRLVMFAPELAGKAQMTAAKVEAMAKALPKP